MQVLIHLDARSNSFPDEELFSSNRAFTGSESSMGRPGQKTLSPRYQATANKFHTSGPAKFKPLQHVRDRESVVELITVIYSIEQKPSISINRNFRLSYEIFFFVVLVI